MRNAAQRFAIKATGDQEAASTIELPSNGLPVAVGVSYDPVTESLVFSYDDQLGTQLSWKAGGYALVINFSWSNQPFSELFAKTPACWFSNTSPAQSDTPTTQTCCIPPVPGWYHIATEVSDTTGTTTVKKVVDPVIVVTPIITP